MKKQKVNPNVDCIPNELWLIIVSYSDNQSIQMWMKANSKFNKLLHSKEVLKRFTWFVKAKEKVPPQKIIKYVQKAELCFGWFKDTDVEEKIRRRLMLVKTMIIRNSEFAFDYFIRLEHLILEKTTCFLPDFDNLKNILPSLKKIEFDFFSILNRKIGVVRKLQKIAPSLEYIVFNFNTNDYGFELLDGEAILDSMFCIYQDIETLLTKPKLKIIIDIAYIIWSYMQGVVNTNISYFSYETILKEENVILIKKVKDEDNIPCKSEMTTEQVESLCDKMNEIYNNNNKSQVI
jgi:hypothetical protein